MSDETKATESAGAQRRRRAQGSRADQLHAAVASLDPQLTEWGEGFIFGDLWGRPGLSQDERLLVAIVSLATLEHREQLKNYLWGALQAGIPARKIHEALLMLIVYAGFPVGINAVAQFKDIVASARRHGLAVDLEM